MSMNAAAITTLLKMVSIEVPGVVKTKTTQGDVWIRPSVALQFDDGTDVTQFRAPKGSCVGMLEEGSKVLFAWPDAGANGDPAALAENVTQIDNATHRRSQKGLEAAASALVAIQSKPGGPATTVDDLVELLASFDDPALGAALIARSFASSRTKREADEELRAVDRLIAKRKKALKTKETEVSDIRRRLDEAERALRQKSEFLNSFTTPQNSGPLNDAAPAELETLSSRWRDGSSGRASVLLDEALLSCTCASALSGSLVLAHGPVGTGKTSTLERLARFLGGNAAVVPVRPAWVEPADALGYFDPLAEQFRPGPVTEELAQMVQESALSVLCLDELNLARIENYLSDVLSRLEREAWTSEPRRISLYESTEYEVLATELDVLRSFESPDLQQARRRQRLELSLATFPAKFLLPDGVIFAGTLNADESTYELSPKVIDRSYALLFPPVDVGGADAATPDEPDSGRLSLDDLRQAGSQHLQSTARECAKQWRSLCTDLDECGFAELAVPLSYRTRRDFRVLWGVAGALRMDPELATAVFAWTRVLPRIHCRRSEETAERLRGLLAKLDSRMPTKQDPAWRFTVENLRSQAGNATAAVLSYWSGTSRMPVAPYPSGSPQHRTTSTQSSRIFDDDENPF